MNNIAIEESPIHGRGVFAQKDIDIGETLIDWTGCTELLSNRDIELLPQAERKYLSFINGQHILFKPPARFVNHSCNPNARGANGRDIAIRKIARGEEVTVDYVVEQVPGLDLQCNCRASGCRGHLRVP